MKAQDWVPNTGIKPNYRVDIKLKSYDFEFAWIDCIRFNQDPDNWDWQMHIGDCEITHHRASKREESVLQV